MTSTTIRTGDSLRNDTARHGRLGHRFAHACPREARVRRRSGSATARGCLFIFFALIPFIAAYAAESSDARGPNETDETQQVALPEHRVRPLPADTFKPSEEISEDFAVPFPVDI